MLNPGAQPWYPTRAAAPQVPVPPVRRQNDPYQFSVVQPAPPQRPPTPLCGDSDLGAMQLAAPAAPPAAPPRKGPYRSTMLLEEPHVFDGRPKTSRRERWAKAAPLRLSTGTLSSQESQGDSREASFMPKGETHCRVASRTVTPKVFIPLPRSQRSAEVRSATSSVSKNATPLPAPVGLETNTDTTTNITTTATTNTTTTTTTTTATTPTATLDGGSNDNANIPDVTSNGDADADAAYCEGGDARDAVNEVVDNTIPVGPSTPLSVFPISGQPVVATKKPKAKAKREEKWTIVQGKMGADSAAVLVGGSLKKSTSLSRSTNVREDGVVVRVPGLNTSEKGKNKQRQQRQQNHHHQREKEDEESVKVEVIIEGKTKRPRDSRRTKTESRDDELLESLVIGAAASATTSGAAAVTTALSLNHNFLSTTCKKSSPPFVIMGVPLAGITQGEQLLPSSSQGNTRQQNAFRIFLRSLTVSESSIVKTLLLQRALRLLPESSYHQCPELVCGILLETSDSCVDVEKSLQTCYKALQLAERHRLDLFEMLSRLAITRTFARIIDTMDARANLTRAAVIAIDKNEKAVLGWIAMQMGVTLEISGLFPESLAWYEVADRLAQATNQPQLLCDIYCCQSIAFSAIGELDRAQQAYESSRALLPLIPRHRHQRPLQNYAQLKCQLGDMLAALHLQETELEIAKELGDVQAASRCMGAIALTKRYLGRYDEAAENYMEELSVYNAQDPRQTIESLTGAAACWRLGGHLQKAYDYALRALRQAQQCQDLTTLAKALVEVAEAELSLNLLDKSYQHLHESLATVARVDEAEQKQYLVKAALCEVEWRCCSILERVHLRKDEVFEALQCSDRCHVPNTAQVTRLLLRRQRQAGILSGTEDSELVKKTTVEELLKSPAMRGWRIVCFSLPWDEGLDFMAYVLGLNSDNDNINNNNNNSSSSTNGGGGGYGSGDMTSVGIPLRLERELIALICAPNALTKVFDEPMYTEDGARIYGDTPLWPQLYSKVAFEFYQSPESAERVRLLANDQLYCLQLLYNRFIRPLEAYIGDAKGLMFVGDGVFSRLPFHAFHDGQGYLAERFCTSTCCSMALLCTHFADRIIKKDEEDKEKDDDEVEREKARRYTVVDDASRSTVLLDAHLARAADEGVCVRRVVIDDDIAAGGADGETRCNGQPGEDETTFSDDADVAATQRLLCHLHRRGKVRSVRNALYRAVHEAAGGVLELRLRVVPEVREDYCGLFVGASSDVIASQSGEVANTWDLRPYSLVVCSGVGTYSGLSIHETGIPVYRSLQYAGARRMLMAVNSRLPMSDCTAAAAIAAALDGHNVAAAVRDAYVQCIADGVPLEEWATFSLVGLP